MIDIFSYWEWLETLSVLFLLVLNIVLCRMLWTDTIHKQTKVVQRWDIIFIRLQLWLGRSKSSKIGKYRETGHTLRYYHIKKNCPVKKKSDAILIIKRSNSICMLNFIALLGKQFITFLSGLILTTLTLFRMWGGGYFYFYPLSNLLKTSLPNWVVYLFLKL